jgi:hypothetical protein
MLTTAPAARVVTGAIVDVGSPDRLDRLEAPPLLACEPLPTPLWNQLGLSEIFPAPIVDFTGLYLPEVGIASQAIGTDDDAAGGICVTLRAKLCGDIE